MEQSRDRRIAFRSWNCPDATGTTLNDRRVGQAYRRRARRTAILDRFLHHAELIQIKGKSYRLKNAAKAPETPKPATSAPGSKKSKPAKAPTG